jgi:DNA-binding NtrC family response regulator
MSIVIPPLRERANEIEPLARHFVRTIATSNNRPPPVLAEDALSLLRTYTWPGNVRELRNVIERAVILCTGGEIRVQDLPREKMQAPFLAGPTPTVNGAEAAPGPGDITLPIMPRARRSSNQPLRSGAPTLPPTALPASSGGRKDDEERARIYAALDRCAGNQTQAAQLLGMSRRTLINRLEKYAMPRPRKRSTE